MKSALSQCSDNFNTFLQSQLFPFLFNLHIILTEIFFIVGPLSYNQNMIAKLKGVNKTFFLLSLKKIKLQSVTTLCLSQALIFNITLFLAVTSTKHTDGHLGLPFPDHATESRF